MGASTWVVGALLGTLLVAQWIHLARRTAGLMGAAELGTRLQKLEQKVAPPLPSFSHIVLLVLWSAPVTLCSLLPSCHVMVSSALLSRCVLFCPIVAFSCVCLLFF